MWALAYYLNYVKRSKFETQERLTLDFMAMIKPEWYEAIVKEKQGKIEEEVGNDFTADDLDELDAFLNSLDESASMRVQDIDEDWV